MKRPIRVPAMVVSVVTTLHWLRCTVAFVELSGIGVGGLSGFKDV